MVYGSEAWILDDKAKKMLNGANSRMMAHITGRSVREEASPSSRTFDVLTWIRARRLQWVGHILRLKGTDEDRLIHKALQWMYENRKDGDLLLDVSKHKDWKHLKKLAANRKYWRRIVRIL